MILRITWTALQSRFTLLKETRVMVRSKHMLSGGLSISIVCSLHFLEENRNNLKDVVSVRIAVLAIKDVVIYGVLL